MDNNTIIRRYSAIRASMIAEERTGYRSQIPRESLLQETEAAVRHCLDKLPLYRRQRALRTMERDAVEIEATEASIDCVPFNIVWPHESDKDEREADRTEKCPCPRVDDCPLMFKAIGYDPGQLPGERATQDELSQCPLRRPPALELRGVCPVPDFEEWWGKVKDKPVAGVLVAKDDKGVRHEVGQVSGNTIPLMMRLARRMLRSWRQRKGRRGKECRVWLLMWTAVDKAR